MADIPEAIEVLRKTHGTLHAMRHMQEVYTDIVLEISNQAALQLKSLNIAMDVAYRNREILSCGQASIDLVNAIQQAVFFNYEIISHIKRIGEESKVTIAKLREVENGGV